MFGTSTFVFLSILKCEVDWTHGSRGYRGQLDQQQLMFSVGSMFNLGRDLQTVLTVWLYSFAFDSQQQWLKVPVVMFLHPNSIMLCFWILAILFVYSVLSLLFKFKVFLGYMIQNIISYAFLHMHFIDQKYQYLYFFIVGF